MKTKIASRILIAATAALALGAAPTARPVQQQSGQETRSPAIRNGQTTRQIEEDHFGGYAGGIGRGLMRSSGHSPRDWGMSAACRRMVRKNKMHRMGIAHAKI